MPSAWPGAASGAAPFINLMRHAGSLAPAAGGPSARHGPFRRCRGLLPWGGLLARVGRLVLQLAPKPGLHKGSQRGEVQERAAGGQGPGDGRFGRVDQLVDNLL